MTAMTDRNDWVGTKFEKLDLWKADLGLFREFFDLAMKVCNPEPEHRSYFNITFGSTFIRLEGRSKESLLSPADNIKRFHYDHLTDRNWQGRPTGVWAVCDTDSSISGKGRIPSGYWFNTTTVVHRRPAQVPDSRRFLRALTGNPDDFEEQMRTYLKKHT